MSIYTCLILCAVAVSSGYTESDESWRNEELKSLQNECLKTFALTDVDLEAVMKTGDVSKINSCSCGRFFKKIGLLNAEGQYDLDNYLSTMRKFWNRDNFAGLEELGKRCAPVKDIAVKDGEVGCEKGVLLAACFLKIDD